MRRIQMPQWILKSKNRGNSGIGYSIVERYRLPSLMFTKEEVTAFLTAEKVIGQLTDTRNRFAKRKKIYGRPGNSYFNNQRDREHQSPD